MANRETNETMEEYLLTSLSTRTCPFSFALIDGSTALITFTGPKNLVSNWSRISVCVSADVDNSSTAPMTAAFPSAALLSHSMAEISSRSRGRGPGKPSLQQQNSTSIRPNASTASATAAWHELTHLPSHLDHQHPPSPLLSPHQFANKKKTRRRENNKEIRVKNRETKEQAPHTCSPISRPAIYRPSPRRPHLPVMPQNYSIALDLLYRRRPRR